MYRFHPQWQLVFDRLRAGAIGELRIVRSLFTFTVRDPGEHPAPARGRRRLALRRRLLLRQRGPLARRSRAGRRHRAHAPQPRRRRRGVPGHPRLRLRAEPRRSRAASLSPTATRSSCSAPTGASSFRPRSSTAATRSGSRSRTRDGNRERVDTPGDDEYRLEVEYFAACVRDGTPARGRLARRHAREHEDDRRALRVRAQRPRGGSLARQRQVDPAPVEVRLLDRVDHLLHPGSVREVALVLVAAREDLVGEVRGQVRVVEGRPGLVDVAAGREQALRAPRCRRTRPRRASRPSASPSPRTPRRAARSARPRCRRRAPRSRGSCRP